jgi:hypothetical protein
MAALNLISLNGTELTDQGRTFNEVNNEKVVDIELANGGLRRYLKGRKKTFSFSWDWCPNSSADTYDAKGGRDAIRAAAFSGTSMVLVLRSHPTNAASTYRVVLSNYTEDLLKRDYVSNRYFYNIKLDLTEV